MINAISTTTTPPRLISTRRTGVNVHVSQQLRTPHFASVFDRNFHRTLTITDRARAYSLRVSFSMRRLAFAVSLMFAATAAGAIYENTLEIDDEDDLFELQQNGDISDDTADTLLELIREGVDLNSADRDKLYDLPGLSYADVDAIMEYRTAKGRIDDPTELVSAGAITSEQLVQISPFIRIDAARPVLPISGRVRLQTRYTNADNMPPPALLNARLKGPFNLSAGFQMFMTRRRTSRPVYDDLNDALSVTDFKYTPQLPRFFAMWSPGKAKLVAGTYTIGFAERLTLDTTRRTTPRGIYLIDDYRRPTDLSSTCRITNPDFGSDPTNACDNTSGKNTYVTPDYTYREVFRGVAGQIEDLEVGTQSSFSLYGFASYQNRSIYQYQLYDQRYCDDPNDDNSSGCQAPTVYVNGGPGTLKFSTLNNVFDELAGGGHVTFKPISRIRLGVTGWGALPIFPQSPMQLSFQEYSRYPAGGAFGAVGVDGHVAWRAFNFYLEASRSFDHRPWVVAANNGGISGGFGVEQRSTFSPKGHEFELSLRYYDLNFGTPFSRPISGPDQIDGLRARNELGARFRWLGHLSKDFEARLRADFWVNPYAETDSSTGNVTMPAGIPNIYGLARLDFVGWSFFQPAVWVDARNRNLLSNAVRGGCSSGGTGATSDDGSGSSQLIDPITGNPVVCAGDFYRLAVQLTFVPFKRYLHATLKGYYTWRDDPKYTDRFRNDVQAYLDLKSSPVDFLQFRLRTRYLNQAIDDNTYLEQSLWSFFEAAWLFTKGARVALRYDLYVWLDKRDSTAARVPNPEHRFQLDFRYSF